MEKTHLLVFKSFISHVATDDGFKNRLKVVGGQRTYCRELFIDSPSNIKSG